MPEQKSYEAPLGNIMWEILQQVNPMLGFEIRQVAKFLLGPRMPMPNEMEEVAGVMFRALHGEHQALDDFMHGTHC